MKNCIQGDDATGPHHMSLEEGIKLTLFTNAMQAGYAALHRKETDRSTLLRISRDIELHAESTGKLDDELVQNLLHNIGERIPQTMGGWA